MKTSDDLPVFALSFHRQLEHPVTCVMCGKPIPLRPSNLALDRPFIAGNFLHDVPKDGAKWRDVRPRHVSCAPR